MSRFFAVPVLATVLALVGIRMLGTSPTPRVEHPLAIEVAPPLQEPEAAPAPIVTAEDYWAPAPPGPSSPPLPPKAEPSVIVLEAPPQAAPEGRTEIVERTVYIPQQTVIYAPTTNIYYPPAPEAPPPPQEVVGAPVLVVMNPPHGLLAPPLHRPRAQQDTFFKEIPFMPPTPRGPRWSP